MKQLIYISGLFAFLLLGCAGGSEDTAGSTALLSDEQDTASDDTSDGPDQTNTQKVSHEHGKRHQKPPQEAIDACETLAKGAACTVSFEDETIQGTCRSPDAEHPLACAPNPPEALITSCKNKAENDSCTLTHPTSGETLQGVCHTDHHDESVLVCGPGENTKRHQGPDHGFPGEGLGQGIPPLVI